MRRNLCTLDAYKISPKENQEYERFTKGDQSLQYRILPSMRVLDHSKNNLSNKDFISTTESATLLQFQLYSSHQILLVKISSTTNKPIMSTIEHISLAPQVLDHSNNNLTNKDFISNIQSTLLNVPLQPYAFG